MTSKPNIGYLWHYNIFYISEFIPTVQRSLQEGCRLIFLPRAFLCWDADIWSGFLQIVQCFFNICMCEGVSAVMKSWPLQAFARMDSSITYMVFNHQIFKANFGSNG